MTFQTQLVSKISARKLANELGCPFHGPDVDIVGVAPTHDAKPSYLSFFKKTTLPDHFIEGILIAPTPCIGHTGGLIESETPRFDFVRALALLHRLVGFRSYEKPPHIHPSVKIGQYAIIGNDVEIGEGTVIHHHVVICDGVRIGKGCVLKSGCVIGEEGFGFEKGQDGIPQRMMHLGSVRIGNRVEIGSLSTVCRGALQDTIIEDNAKIDDHVHISHNCFIGANVLVAAGATLGGSSHIEEDATLWVNCALKPSTRVGKKAIVGMGSAVLKPVPAGATVFGNPARAVGAS